MSNAKLKEQIEAAKIALVHSAENNRPVADEDAGRMPEQAAMGRSEPANPSTNSRIMAAAPAPLSQMPSEISGQDTIPKSDYDILEARIKGLEEQIQNQQRDLHTLLQKLRDITAKSKQASAPKKRKMPVKLGLALMVFFSGIAAAYFTVGTDRLIAIAYDIAGLALTLIDTLISTF